MILDAILIHIISQFGAIGLQQFYISLIGLNGFDSRFPKFTKWINESSSIFALPLGKCLQCNLFWFKALCLVFCAILMPKNLVIIAVLLTFDVLTTLYLKYGAILVQKFKNNKLSKNT